MKTLPLAACAFLWLGAHPGAAAAAGLPGHFGVGVEADLGDEDRPRWMIQTKVPWDYAYLWLSGGINTDDRWQGYHDNAVFPIAVAGELASNRYLPVFTYSQLLDSKGPCDECEEQEKVLAHLNDASLMAAYFEDFRMLMRRLGPRTWDGVEGFGGTAIVHVEPNLSAYVQQAVLDNALCHGHCTGRGNDPGLAKAAVSSSKLAEVAGFADTYQGYSQAMVRLRDLYAPNVLLAFHISNWTTGPDIGTDQAGLNADELGRKAGEFAAAAGVRTSGPDTSTYDLVFNDLSDVDAGHAKLVRKEDDAFWDSLNVRLPNFTRWERYLAAATQATGKKAIVWQVPVGNQRFRTMNNTEGHYQDNRGEYFFSHAGELMGAGVIALLFGGGDEASTRPWDAQKDGVTNPASTCTTDGRSEGKVCANEESKVADDDGGFLRSAAAEFLKAPPKLGAKAPERPGAARTRTGGLPVLPVGILGVLVLGGASFVLVRRRRPAAPSPAAPSPAAPAPAGTAQRRGIPPLSAGDATRSGSSWARAR